MEILLTKIKNVRSRLGNSSTDEGLLISSPTLWGAIYELIGMISWQVVGPWDGDIFSPEELEKLQDLFETYCVSHVKPLVEYSLQDYYVTTTAT